MEVTLEKKSMMGISVWTDWYIRTTPHTGLLEYQNVYRPARVMSFCQKTGELCLENYMNYVDLKDYIDLVYEVNCDGKLLEKKPLTLQDSVWPHREEPFCWILLFQIAENVI